MTYDERLDGRVVIVTGGGHGIGAATSKRLAAEGASVIVADIDEEAAANVVHGIVESGGTAWSEAMDVASADSWRHVRIRLDDLHLVPDTIVHNAFALKLAPIDQQSDVDWDRQMAVGIGAVQRSMSVLWDDLSTSLARTQRPACLLMISSIHALAGVQSHPAYASYKAGMLALARQLSVEYGPLLRVNSILPGPILTRAWDGSSEADIEAWRRQTTIGRMGTPDDIASAAAFLISDEASYITGTSLLVDGGWATGRMG